MRPLAAGFSKLENDVNFSTADEILMQCRKLMLNFDMALARLLNR